MPSLDQAKLNADVMIQLIRNATFYKKRDLIIRFAKAVSDGTEQQVIAEITEELSCITK